MAADADLAAAGAALADETRASMLLALLGGDALSAGELARIAGRSPSGASAHLRTLQDVGFVVVEERGRNRYFRLASPGVADALEALARVSPPRPAKTLRQSEAARAVKRARTCYDHLAGELGVAVTDALVGRGVLEPGDAAFRVTASGTAWLDTLGIDVTALERQPRSLARACLDWTERRPHVAGAVGAALAARFFERKWAQRLPGGRAIRLTPAGRSWVERELGLRLA